MKLLKLLLVFILTITLVSEHIHDEYCGYDESTNEGCIYDTDPYKQGKGDN